MSLLRDTKRESVRLDANHRFSCNYCRSRPKEKSVVHLLCQHYITLKDGSATIRGMLQGERLVLWSVLINQNVTAHRMVCCYMEEGSANCNLGK